MNSIKRFLFFTISITMICSCEKVIDIQLNNSNTKYVIEAIITNQPGGTKILLSQTKNFSDNNSFNGISGATITVEGNGKLSDFTYMGAGVYTNTNLVGIPGNTYKLNVNVNGQLFTSTSTMPSPVNLDSLYVVDDNPNTNKDGSVTKYAMVRYKDPLILKNYYRFIQYINGNQEKSIFGNTDEFTNGEVVNDELVFTNDNDDPKRDIKKGDKLTIEMLCIDQNVFKYWYSLIDNSTGDGNAASPANPISNISGGALGYFSAQTIQSKTIIIP